jgi:hypothetical protein
MKKLDEFTEGMSIGNIILPNYGEKIKFDLEELNKIIDKSDFIYIIGGDYDLDAKKDLVAYISWYKPDVYTCGVTNKKFYVDNEGLFYDFYKTPKIVYRNRHNPDNSTTINIFDYE